MSIKSRPDLDELSTVVKIDRFNSQSLYDATHMTDRSVYELASHFFTLEEIAAFFNISIETVVAHHGEAFRKGKLYHQMKPRILFDKMITDVMNAGEELGFSDKETEHLFRRAKELIEMKWKKTEGYGAPINVIGNINSTYDVVESKPIIIERQDEE